MNQPLMEEVTPLEIRLNEQQSKIWIDIAVKDLLPKELERIKKEREANRDEPIAYSKS